MPEFRAFMDSVNNDTLPDGAWREFMETKAAEFMRQHSVRGGRNEAFLQWVSPE